MRALILLVCLAACPGGRHASSPPAPAPPPPRPCTTQILKQKQFDPVASLCVAELLERAPVAVGQALATLRPEELTPERLGFYYTWAVSRPEGWLVALQVAELQNPDIAMRAISLVEASPNPDMQVSAALLKLRLSQRTGDSAPVAHTEELLARLASDDLHAAQILDAAVQGGVTQLVETICKERNHQSIIWTCAEKLPDELHRYLGRIARWPILSRKDGERLQQIQARMAGVPPLPGLSCLGTLTFRPGRLQPSPRSRDRETATQIYYRLSNVATTQQEAGCLLERASASCAGLLKEGERCPAPSAIAEYARLLEKSHPALFDLLIKDLFDMKAVLYFEPGRSKNVESVLCALHLLLAELLQDVKAESYSRLSSFHVSQASRLWPQFNDHGIPLREVLPGKLLDAICQERECDLPCRGSSWRECQRECGAYAATYRRQLCSR